VRPRSTPQPRPPAPAAPTGPSEAPIGTQEAPIGAPAAPTGPSEAPIGTQEAPIGWVSSPQNRLQDNMRPPPAKKDRRVTVRLTEEQYNELVFLARSLGVSPTLTGETLIEIGLQDYAGLFDGAPGLRPLPQDLGPHLGRIYDSHA